jgi:PAS domain S-box-containing protein
MELGEYKDNKQLLMKIDELNKRILELETSEAECKNVEKTLKERENYQKTVFSAIQTGIVVIDSETQQIIDLNEVAAEHIGASKAEIIGHSCHKYICPADEGKCPIIDLNQKVNHSERILLDVNGNQIPIIKNVVSVNLNGRDCLLESFINITERQKAEEALKKSEKKYRDISEKFLKVSNEILQEMNKPEAEKKSEEKYHDIVEKFLKVSNEILQVMNKP